MSDYICYQLKSLGKLSNRPDFKKGCSALDLDIQAFAGHNRDPHKNTITNYLGLVDPKKGIYVGNSAKLNPEEYLDIAMKKGICPEGAMPSEFGADGLDLRKVYLALQQHLKERKANTQAGVALDGWCKECHEIAPSLAESQWNAISDLLATTDLDTQDFQVLKKIDDIACPDNKRVKLPSTFKKMNHSTFELMNAHLATQDAIAIMGIHATPLLPPGASIDDREGDGHEVVVYGTTTFPDSPTCYYALKVSWGPGACVQKLPDVRCSIDGSFLVSASLLKTMQMDIQW